MAIEPPWDHDIDSDTKRALSELWELAGEPFGDLFSAVCRPGSWEYQLGFARACRKLLNDRGYHARTHPSADWLLVWKPGRN